MVDGVFTIRLFADHRPDRAPSPDADHRGRSDSAAAESALPRSSLEFLAGPENRLAAVAVTSLLEERPSRYNPLVFYGPSGTGKTHLAHGLAQSWNESGSSGSEKQPSQEPAASRHAVCDGAGARDIATGDLANSGVVYATAAEFSQWLNSAIESDTTEALRRRLRSATLLVVEDLTQFANRRVAQQELIHTLDAVLDQQGQAIFTSRMVPAKVPGLSPALCSRLAGGLAVPLVPPAAGARLACVERIAELRGVALPAAAARLLATGLSVTVPELFGAVTDLYLQSQVDGLPIDAARVRRWLAERQLRLRPSLRTITRLSAKYFGLRVTELTSPSRQRNVVQARAIAMYLARQLTGKSLEQVGTHFGGRDHTTVLHNCRSIEGRVRGDPTTRRAIADIRKMLAYA